MSLFNVCNFRPSLQEVQGYPNLQEVLEDPETHKQKQFRKENNQQTSVKVKLGPTHISTVWSSWAAGSWRAWRTLEI